jgi:hypothetical protein
LKQLFTSAPILRISYSNENSIVCTKACKEGLGGVLSQNGFVISYESKKLKENENKYVTHDLELVAIIHTLKKWRYYLMGRIFELRTDHNGLKYLIDQLTLNARQSRWLEFLCEYEFDIKHIKGNENKVVDALNKRVHELHVTTISMYQTDIKGKNFEAANADLEYRDLVAKLQHGKILQKVEYVGHPGYHKIEAIVKSHYFWPGMKKEISYYIARCMECQKVKDEHRHPTGLL